MAGVTMAKKSESPATGAVAANAAVSAVTTDHSTDTSETATAAAVAAQGEDKAQTLPMADPTVELDDVDKAAAGSWDDLDDPPVAIDGSRLIAPRRMTVAYKSGIYLRIGPGKKFEHHRVLPFGALVFPALVPDYAKVPGWLCVGTDGGNGEIVYGWVDETLVADAAE